MQGVSKNLCLFCNNLWIAETWSKYWQESSCQLSAISYQPIFWKRLYRKRCFSLSVADCWRL